MARIGQMVREIWFPTALFILASVVGFAKWSGIRSSLFGVIPLALVAPPIWWGVVVRRQRGRVAWGILGGALIGLASLVLSFFGPALVYYARAPHRLSSDWGHDDWGLALTVVIIIGGTVVGSVVGLVAATVQWLASVMRR